MALTTTVQSVRAAIIDCFRQATEREPSAAEIIAASGVSDATYYRVMKADATAANMLDAARAAFRDRTHTTPGSEPEDPIEANPHGAVRELSEVIVRLLHIVEDQRETIRRLKSTQPSGRPTRPTRLSDHRRSPSSPSDLD